VFLEEGREAQEMAQKQSNGASEARAILIARRERVVSRLATIYSSNAVADLISISKAIEILEELERLDRKPMPLPEIGAVSTGGQRGPHEED
jgi:hypothetical protein